MTTAQPTSIFPTPCTCQRPGWCDRHACQKSPTLFHLCRTRIELFRAWESGIGPGQRQATERASLPACRYRSQAPVGEMLCDLCGGREIVVPIYGCSLFGRCTERRYGTRTREAREMPDCLRCDHYVSDTGQPLDGEARHPAAEPASGAENGLVGPREITSP
jgi:hypothetical protein